MILGQTGIENPWIEYDFDAAILLLNRYIKFKLSEKDDQGHFYYSPKDIPALLGVKMKRTSTKRMGDLANRGIRVRRKQG